LKRAYVCHFDDEFSAILIGLIVHFVQSHLNRAYYEVIAPMCKNMPSATG